MVDRTVEMKMLMEKKRNRQTRTPFIVFLRYGEGGGRGGRVAKYLGGILGILLLPLLPTQGAHTTGTHRYSAGGSVSTPDGMTLANQLPQVFPPDLEHVVITMECETFQSLAPPQRPLWYESDGRGFFF